MTELKSIEKPKIGETRTLLKDTGYQNDDLEIVFSIKEWRAIDKEAQKLEEAIQMAFQVLAGIPCLDDRDVDDAIQEAHDILDAALHVWVIN